MPIATTTMAKRKSAKTTGPPISFCSGSWWSWWLCAMLQKYTEPRQFGTATFLGHKGSPSWVLYLAHLPRAREGHTLKPLICAS